MSGQLQDKVQQLKTAYYHYENELVTYERVPRPLNRRRRSINHLAKVDSSSTMRCGTHETKVEEDEALAQAYGEVGQVDTRSMPRLTRPWQARKTSQAAKISAGDEGEAWDHVLSGYIQLVLLDAFVPSP